MKELVVRKGNNVTDKYRHRCYILNNKNDAIALENTLTEYYSLKQVLHYLNIESIKKDNGNLLKIDLKGIL